MCPYTPFIPIEYLRFNTTTLSKLKDAPIPSVVWNNSFSALNSQYEQSDRILIGTVKRNLLKNNFISSCLLYAGVSQPVYETIEHFLNCDKPISSGSIESTSINNTSEMASKFNCTRGVDFTLRTFSGLLGDYSLAVKDESGQFTYHILAVVLPENLFYQKLHLLMTGEIDMSYVIFLVDEQLQSTEFPIRGLRTFYLGRLKSMLQATTGKIHFVPKEFINKACFIENFQPSRKIKERKLTIASMGIMFRKYLNTGGMDMSLLYKEAKEQEVKPVGPLVGTVDPTDLVEKRFAQLSPGIDNSIQVSRPLYNVPVYDLETVRGEMLTPQLVQPEDDLPY